MTLMKFERDGYVLDFLEGASYPARRPITKTQVTDRTAANTLETEDLGISIRQRVLNFEDMVKEDHDNLQDWFDNIVNGGELEFEFTDERGDVGTVVIVDKTFDFREDDFELFSGQLTLEYV